MEKPATILETMAMARTLGRVRYGILFYDWIQTELFVGKFPPDQCGDEDEDHLRQERFPRCK
jgi:hypothetical protein